MTMLRTSIIPIMSGLVSSSELPAALTLNAVAGNLGRIVGSAVGGFIVAIVASWAVFFLNSASFIGMIIVLSRLPKKSDQSTKLSTSREYNSSYSSSDTLYTLFSSSTCFNCPCWAIHIM
jgi:MFS family permease